MNTKFSCSHCNAAVEASADQSGMAGDCPACGELIIVPVARTKTQGMPRRQKVAPAPRPVPRARPLPSVPPTGSRPGNTAEDYAAAVVCATAKGAWTATKVVAPILGRIAAKIVARAATAAAPHVGKAAKSTWKAVKPTEREVVQTGAKFIVWKLLGF